MSRPYVCLYVSQLASCMGLDRYRTIDRAFETVWRRVDPGGFDRAYKRCERMCHDDAVKQALERDVTTQQAIHAFSGDISRFDSQTAGRTAQNLVQQYTGRYGKTAPEVEEALRSRVYTDYGTACEKSVFDCINRRGLFPTPVVNDNTFYSVPGGRVGGQEWYIGGRVDGCLSDRSAVVEIKNRVYKLYRQIRPHDMIQVQAYSHLLDIPKAFLVECYRHNQGLELCVMATMRDDRMWREFVLPRLQAFVSVLFWVMADCDVQDTLVRCDEKPSLVASWVDKFLASELPGASE